MNPPLGHSRELLFDSPLVMGILNVTPDSFSDGGRFVERSRAVEHALAMIADGADIVDVGPESTRPGARPVPAGEQLKRCIPVIESIRDADDTIPISIDTTLAPVAGAAIRAGADIINDVSALRDDRDMVHLAAAEGVPVVLMHRRGTPETMQRGGGPHYDDVIAEISAFLRQRAEFAVSRGVDAARIILDPGLGFGKRVEHNLLIMRRLHRFVELGYPLLIGASRKRFIGGASRRIPSGTSEGQALDGARSVSAVRVAGGPRSIPPPRAAGFSPRDSSLPDGKRTALGPESEEDIRSSMGRLPDRSAGKAGSLACAAVAVMAGVSIIRAHDVRATAEVVRLCAAIRAAGE